MPIVTIQVTREGSGPGRSSVTADELDFADLGRIAGDADQAIDEPVGIFCALSVIR